MRRPLILIFLLIICAFAKAQNCPCGNNVNLFTNGDFESGELLPAETEMNIWNVNCNLEFGCYSIVTSASEVGGQFNGWAHGGQEFMFVDGQDFSAGNQPQQVWSQTVNCLIPGENYQFKFWLLGCSGFGDIFVLDATVTANGNTTVLSENTLINTMMDNSNAPLEWQQYSFAWNATSTTATFALDQISFNSSGFDFGLDDIRLMGESDMDLLASAVSSTISCTGNPGFIEVTPVNGAGPYTYALSNAAGPLQNAEEIGAATFQMADPGIYTVEITDAGNCTTEIEIEVLQDDVLQVAVATVEPTCLANGQFTILPLAGEEPFAVESNGVALNELTNPAPEGNYAITVTDNNGCSFDTTLIFVVDNPVVADFDYAWDDNQLLLQNESTASNEFNWSLNDIQFSSEENPALDQIFEPGTYTLVLLAMDSITGCVDSIQKSLILEDDFALYIPNCITADDDGVNDYFFVQGSVDRLRSFQCSVYNRWGEKVFSTNNANVPWTASINQGEHYTMDGVYTYRIEYQLKDRIEVEELTGHLTVLR